MYIGFAKYEVEPGNIKVNISYTHNPFFSFRLSKRGQQF